MTSLNQDKSKRGIFSKFDIYSWLDRRHQPKPNVTLHVKNLYVFPTLSGIFFTALALLIWMLGTNYQNNLILALAYLQISTVIVVILHTFNNLSGLKIRFRGSQENYAGAPLGLLLDIYCRNKRGCDNLVVQWDGDEHLCIAVEPGQTQSIKLHAKASKRGWYQPGRLYIASTYPMGIIRCWTRLRLDAGVWVYPEPIACAFPDSSGESSDGPSKKSQSDAEDFNGFKRFVSGMPLNQIAWKVYAKEKGLVVKDFHERAGSICDLNWQDFDCGDKELSLSHLCYWVECLHQQGFDYSLRLPGVDIERSAGDLHRQQCLRALARY